MRWFPGCSQFSPIWEKDVCNLGFSVYISDCLWLWLGWMAVYFIRQAVGAYCIRPSNVLLETILHYAKTCLRCLRQHMWGVCNTPLPHTDKEGFPNEKRGVFASLIFFSCLDARKEAKEDQGIRDAGQISGIQLIWMYPAKLPRPRKRAWVSFASFLFSRKEKKVALESQVRLHNLLFFSW